MPTKRLPFRRHLDELPSGLPFVTIELPHLHSVSIVMYAKVGSRYESARDNGLSHFLEHMLFRGTKALPDAYRLSQAIEAIGGTLYAETGRDYSLYQVSLHPDSLAAGIELFGEIFSVPVFADLDVERRVILEEMSEDLDDKGRFIQIDDIARAAAFPDHKLGQRIIGTRDNVKGFAPTDVRRHFAHGYGGANMLLCISGAVRHGKVLPLVRRAFAAVPTGKRLKATPPKQPTKPEVVITRHASSQTQLQVLFRTFGETDPMYAPLLMLSRIVDDGMSTRLHRRMIDELGLAYYVSGSCEHFHDTGLFEIDGAAAHDNVPAMLDEALRVLWRLRTEVPSLEELDKAKRRYRWDLESTFDDPDAMASWWGGTELFGGPVSYEAKLARIAAVTPDDVRRTAARIFRKERITVAAVGLLGAAQRRQLQRTVNALA
ncbi:MAG: pitrilysin family protein [Polyangia bacterium]